MINSDEVISIGRLTRTHGNKGELVLTSRYDLSEDITFIVLSIDSILVPFRLTAMRERNGESYIVSLLGVTDGEAAQRLCGTEAFVLKRETDGTVESAEWDIRNPAFDLRGYTLVNGEKTVGVIDGIDTSTINHLFVLADGTLVPAHPDFITGIDHKQRLVRCLLPEGLV